MTHFLATARIVHRDGFDEHLPEERRMFDELRAEGVIEEVFVLQAGSRCGQRRRSAEPGPVHAQLRRLPFVTAGILEFDLVEVVPG